MPSFPPKQANPYINHPLLYRIVDATRATGLCRSKIYELIAAGELQTAHFGRAVRITAESLQALIVRRTQPARQPPAPNETTELLKKAVARVSRKPPTRTRANALPEIAHA
jgi:excisionase family DNA binding protein